jgi:N-acetylmuramoyl-L-alanine amidase
MYTAPPAAVNRTKWRRFLKTCRLARMPTARSRRLATLFLLAVGGCRPAAPPAPAPAPVPHGPLAVRVVYPVTTTDSTGRLLAAFESRDSAFVFGSVSDPAARVTVNDIPVEVAPSGAWLAWLALPRDTIAGFVVRAESGGERDSVAFWARLPRRFVPPDTGVWIDSTSLDPVGSIWVRPGEGLTLRVRAVPGARVRLVLSDSVSVPLLPDTVIVPRPWGALAFGTTTPDVGVRRDDHYAGWLVGPLGPTPGPVLGPPPMPIAGDTAVAPFAVLEATRDGDTVRRPWPLRVGVLDPAHPTIAVVNDDTAGTGTTDGVLAGRPAPHATYHWFFPNGTRALVSGRRGDQVRLQLSARTVAWVDGLDIQPLPTGTPPIRGTTQALRMFAGPRSATLRVPLPGPVPFRVDEDGSRLTLTLYGVAANADWIQYGPADPLVSRLAFEAPAEDETRIVIDLARPVWGYRTRWSGNDLLLEIRRPPEIHERRPLEGLLIALDPGHPPGGAHGPTGSYEADAVLAVARAAAPLFERAGARVVLLRDDTLPMDLPARPRAAEAADADLLISIHANALPDGVNPFVNAGTSVYYYHPRAVNFAREVDKALVRAFGSRDLGIGRADLALARPTWMPAILTEGLFMMLPDQEAVLTSVEGQRRYAQGLVDGTVAFLAGWARR